MTVADSRVARSRVGPVDAYDGGVLWLFLAFIVLPVIEIWVITQVAGQLGWPLALLAVIGVSVAGAWLVRREGLGVIRRVQSSLESARMPTNELADGAMIFFASALMLTPGFLTDAVGLALLIPPIRAILRPPVITFFRRRLNVQVGTVGGFGAGGGFGPGPGFGGPGGPPRPRGDVVDVEGHPTGGPEDTDDPGDDQDPRPELS
ncbi:MAG: FxsA family protein [Actinomycetota bacterium]